MKIQAPIRESIAILKQFGSAAENSAAQSAASSFDYEFRTTVVREFHEEKDFYEIGKMISGARHYFLQSFTDRDSVPFEGLHAPFPENLGKYAEIVRPFVPDTQLRGID